MGTRGFIGRVDVTDHSEDIHGVYHHWDSYVEGLGKTLFTIYNGHFAKDAKAMLKYLIDEHPTGWSSINRADFSQPPGFEEKGFKTRGPNCYCHGGRSEPAWNLTLSKAAGSGCEYAYVINPETKVMYVLSSYSENGEKMIGMFGMGDENADWKSIGEVHLDGPEPDWEKMDR